MPQLARARPVSRQHIQALVNPLVAEGLVELGENPAHKRSKFVDLTDQGRQLAENMLRRESELLEIIADEFVADDLLDAAGEFRKLREILSRQTVQSAAERIAQ